MTRHSIYNTVNYLAALTANELSGNPSTQMKVLDIVLVHHMTSR